MRNSLAVMLISALLAAPVAAQSSPEYRAPDNAEIKQLRAKNPSALRKVWAGEAGRSMLTSRERQRIQEMVGAQIEDVRMLGVLKAGGHYHAHWGVWVAVPCVCGTLVLILLILILL